MLEITVYFNSKVIFPIISSSLSCPVQGLFSLFNFLFISTHGDFLSCPLSYAFKIISVVIHQVLNRVCGYIIARTRSQCLSSLFTPSPSLPHCGIDWHRQACTVFILFQDGITVFKSWLLCNRPQPAVSFHFLRCCWPDKSIKACLLPQTPQLPLFPQGCLTQPTALHTLSAPHSCLLVGCTYTQSFFGLFFSSYVGYALQRSCLELRRGSCPLQFRMEEQRLQETGVVR